MSYYHLSRNFIEDEFIYPRSGVVSRWDCWRSHICASPSPEQALRAIGNIHGGTVYIYRIDEEPDEQATKVYDYHLTGEVWYFRPVKFTFVGTTNECVAPYKRCICGECLDEIAMYCC